MWFGPNRSAFTLQNECFALKKFCELNLKEIMAWNKLRKMTRATATHTLEPCRIEKSHLFQVETHSNGEPFETVFPTDF